MAEQVGNTSGNQSGAGAASSGAGAGASSSSSGEGSAVASVEKASSALESASSADKTGTQPAALAKPGGAASTGQGNGGGATFHVPQNKEEYDRILGNAREKAVEELKAKLGWAEGYDADATREAMQLVRQMYQDPRAFAQMILSEGEQEEELVDPDPDYRAPDGSAQFYSDKTVKTLLSNMEKRLMRQMKPALTAADRQAQNEHMQEVAREAQSIATEALAEIKKYPHFEEYKGEIAKKLSSMDPKVRRRVGSVAALHMSYQAVMNENGEKVKQGMEESIRTEFSKKAAAGIGHVQPGNQSQAKPAIKDGDVDALARRMEELAAAQVG